MARTQPVNSGYTIVNGTGTGANGSRIDVWLEYLLGEQNPVDNYTPITVFFYAALKPGYGSSTSYDRGMDSALNVDGEKVAGVTNVAYDFRDPSIVNSLGGYSGNLIHNPDGTRNVALSGSFTTMSTWISGGSVSATIELPTIARASTIGATPANIGEPSVIVVSVNSSAFTHSIAYNFGELNGYINAAGVVVDREEKLTAASILFTVPESFYSQIPNDPSGICTLICTTYYGDAKIGEPQETTFTVTAKEAVCRPIVTGTVVDVNPETLALTGDNKKLVKFQSTANCVISAQAQKQASVEKLSIAGIEITDNVLEIPNVELAAIEFKAVDSRGYPGTDTDENVSIVEYIPLSNLASIGRDDPTSGNATVALSGSYYAGSFGVAANSLTVQYRINGGELITAELEIAFADGKYSGTLALSGLEYTSAHTVEVIVLDKLMQVSKTLKVQKGIPVFDWGENDFRFNVPVSLPELTINGKSLEEYIKALVQGG